MEGLLNDLLGSVFFQFIGWLVGIVAGFIGIYQFLIKDEKKVRDDPKIVIRSDARGICVDCDNIIPNSSSTCSVCYSTNPFDSAEIKIRVFRLLHWNFALARNYSDINREETRHIMLFYIYGYLPAFLLAIVAAIIDKEFSSIVTNAVSIVIALVVLAFYWLLPVGILFTYSSNIRTSMSSMEKVRELDQKLGYMLSSLNDQSVKEAVRKQIAEYIDHIRKAKEVRRSSALVISLYIVAVATTGYFTILMLASGIEQSFSMLVSGLEHTFEINEDLIGRLFSIGFCLAMGYWTIVVFMRTVWVHVSYIGNADHASEYYLSKYI